MSAIQQIINSLVKEIKTLKREQERLNYKVIKLEEEIKNIKNKRSV